MILFLTSSPTGNLDGSYLCEGLDNRNGFADRVRGVWTENARCLMITAFPDNAPANEEMRGFFEDAVKKTGLSCRTFDLWDDRTQDTSEEKLLSYDCIFLGGGHVPTQNAFFKRLQLREKIKSFAGIVIGISAGTMNCADLVYAQPEEPGEAADASYQRWITGLGLTDLNILPHYQLVKDNVLDGMKLFEEITIPDVQGHRAVALVDGSYVVVQDGAEEICGEHYWL